jgi:hypothetical protein
MKYTISLSLMVWGTCFAQNTPTVLNLKELCLGHESGVVSEKEVVVVDGGFCEHFLKLEEENDIKQSIETLNTPLGPSLPSSCGGEILTSTNLVAPNPVIPAKKDQWKFRFYASHSFTTYFNSDISFRSTRYNVDIKDYAWAERSSREFFTPETWKEEGNNPFQMIDEPTNTFTISMEKDGNEFFFQAFHPKFLQADGQIKHMTGTIDGVAVNGFAPVNKPFDVYDQVPGESELVGNMNTHLQMTFEVGYGRRFDFPLGKKIGSFSYTPSISAGVMVGRNHSVYIKENEWWEFDYYDDKLTVQGVGGSLTNRFEYNTPKERFGIFYENKLAGYRQNHGFLDGRQKYNLGFMGNSVGVKFMLYNPANKKNKP